MVSDVKFNIVTLEEANSIAQSWGEHLEKFHSKLMFVFRTKVPKSFLPYSKEKIEKASKMMSDYYSKAGNQEAVNMFQSCAAFLSLYVDNEEALVEAAKSFEKPELRKSILKLLKDNENKN